MEKSRIQTELQAAFPYLTDEHFHRHYSDLYICDVTPEIYQWLRKEKLSFSGFSGEGPWAGKRCIDIAFGAMDAYMIERSKPKRVISTPEIIASITV